jgi:hypothetical protein
MDTTKIIDDALDREFAKVRTSNRDKAYRIVNIIHAEQVYCNTVERARVRFMDSITGFLNG